MIAADEAAIREEIQRIALEDLAQEQPNADQRVIEEEKVEERPVSAGSGQRAQGSREEQKTQYSARYQQAIQLLNFCKSGPSSQQTPFDLYAKAEAD